MNISLPFIRLFFIFLSILFSTIYATATSDGFHALNLALGLISGVLFGLVLIGADLLLRRSNLKSFNLVIVGLFLGYLLGQALWLLLNTALDFSALAMSSQTTALIRMAIYLVSAYLGLVMTARGAEELHMSIPFIKFKPTSAKKKDILIDSSTMTDTRIIDLATCGLLDHHLILPRFVLKDLQAQVENGDEAEKSKARRCLEVIKKLEGIPTLDLRYVDTDFSDVKDPVAKLVRLARLLDANIMTADMSRVQQSSIEGIRIININMLSNALKPLTQSGEYINIKIQRYGKEARQGVGYLDDGTMVVVNSGAEYIGETIKAQVLSVKHTTSGRMIFCNATEENLLSEQELAQSVASLENSHKNYFAL